MLPTQASPRQRAHTHARIIYCDVRIVHYYYYYYYCCGVRIFRSKSRNDAVSRPHIYVYTRADGRRLPLTRLLRVLEERTRGPDESAGRSGTPPPPRFRAGAKRSDSHRSGCRRTVRTDAGPRNFATARPDFTVLRRRSTRPLRAVDDGPFVPDGVRLASSERAHERVLGSNRLSIDTGFGNSRATRVGHAKTVARLSVFF